MYTQGVKLLERDFQIAKHHLCVRGENQNVCTRRSFRIVLANTNISSTKQNWNFKNKFGNSGVCGWGWLWQNIAIVFIVQFESNNKYEP